MKRTIIGLAGASLLLSCMAQAVEGSVSVAKHSTNLTLGLGTQSPGLFLNGNWLRSNDDGSASGAALGYNIDVGSVNFSPAVKALYIHPSDGKDGSVVALGSGVGYRLNSMWGMYGEYFYAPDAFSNHLDNYKEMSAGIRFTPISLVTVGVGYQYAALNNKNGDKDNVLVDGSYINVSVNF